MITRAILDAPLQLAEDHQSGNELKELAEQYMTALFPHHEGEDKHSMSVLQAELKKWVEGTQKLIVKPLPSLTDGLKAARRLKRSEEQRTTVDKRLSRLIQRRINK